MKRIAQLTVIWVAAMFVNGCASSKGFLVDRRRDAADIITATIGFGLGAKAKVGPLQTGILVHSDQLGLRGGTFPDVCDNCEFEGLGANTLDLEFIAVGLEEFDSNDDLTRREHRRKDFWAASAGPFFHRTKDCRSPSYYTQVEAVLSLGLGIRLGANPGELLDFILGFAGMDIFDDDLEARAQQKASNQVPGDTDTARNLADP